MIKRSGRGVRPTARGNLDVAGGSSSSPVKRTRGAVDHRRHTQSEDTNCYAKRYPDLMVRYCHGSMCDVEGLRDPLVCMAAARDVAFSAKATSLSWIQV